MRLSFKGALTVVALAAASLFVATPAHAAPVSVIVDYTLDAQTPMFGPWPNYIAGSCTDRGNWIHEPRAYVERKLTVDTSGTYDLQDRRYYPTLLQDGLAFITKGDYDPNDVSNCLISIDDVGQVNLEAGVTYKMYLSSWRVNNYGLFGFRVTGPGNIFIGDFATSTVSLDADTVDRDTEATLIATPGSDTLGADLSGTVTFILDGQDLGHATIDTDTGQAALDLTVLPAGLYTVTAKYSGVAGKTFPSTTTGTLTVVLAQTTTTLDISPAEVVDGAQTTYTATVSGRYPSGNVEFYHGATLVGISPVIGGVASVTVSPSAGTYDIIANYVGDANYTASSSTVKTLLVKPAGIPGPNTGQQTEQHTQTTPPKQLPSTGTDRPHLAAPIAAGVALFAGLTLMLTRRKITE